jgi:signal transduction histidine kinase
MQEARVQETRTGRVPLFFRGISPGDLEPGLLSVFRFFTWLHLAIAVAGFLAGLAWPQHVPIDYSDYLNLATLVLLLGYLSWPELERRLGRAYFPLALIFATLLPLITRYILMNPERMALHSSAPLAVAIGGSWRLFVALLIPLLLISWQYPFKVVFGYVVVTTLLDALLLWLMRGVQPAPLMVQVVAITLSRTVVFLFTGYIVTRLMAAQRAQRQELADANQQLVRYAATAEQLAVSRERNRLARELHDTVAHTLSALSVQLEAVDSAWEQSPEQAHTLLHKAHASARSGLTETRRALQALRASPLEDLGLALALRSLAESTAARNGLALDLQLPEEVENVSPDVEQVIYRVAQEALANTVKHAAAKQVWLSLTRANGHLTLVVADDGQGFDLAEAEAAGHYGLRGMRERAEMVGGTLHVESAPGQGTRVRLEVARL